MRPWFAALFFLLLAFQTLPISAWVSSSGKQQMTASAQEEEQGHQGSRVKGKSQNPFQLMEEEYHPHWELNRVVLLQKKKASRHLHAAESLPPHFSGEVATPPPNPC